MKLNNLHKDKNVYKYIILNFNMLRLCLLMTIKSALWHIVTCFNIATILNSFMCIILLHSWRFITYSVHICCWGFLHLDVFFIYLFPSLMWSHWWCDNYFSFYIQFVILNHNNILDQTSLFCECFLFYI